MNIVTSGDRVEVEMTEQEATLVRQVIDSLVAIKQREFQDDVYTDVRAPVTLYSNKTSLPTSLRVRVVS